MLGDKRDESQALAHLSISSTLLMFNVYYYRTYQDKKDLIDRSLYALMHYAFYKENRMIIAENGGIPFLKQVITLYIDDKSLVKEAINLAWNLGCDLGKLKIDNIPQQIYITIMCNDSTDVLAA